MSTSDRSLRASLLALLVVCCTALGLGCDSNVNILDREAGLYSIYGALNVHKDVNYIRVKNLDAPLVDDSTRTLNATVTLEDLQTGTTEVLTDSVIQFEDVYTHNFRVTTDIRPDTKYQVTVERPDGRTAQATATTPPIADRTVAPQGADCTTSIRLTFEPVAAPENIDPVLGVEFGGDRRWTPAFGLRSTGPNADLVFLEFTPKQVLNAIFKPVSLNGRDVWCHQLDTNKLYVRYTHYGPDFYGDTPSDSLNVPGGLGQFGGYYKDSFSIRIDTANVCAPDC